jgi:hypothetical protein
MAYRYVAKQRPRNKQEIMAIVRQQLRKHATVLEPLLGSSPRATVELLQPARNSGIIIRNGIFYGSSPRIYHSTPSELSLVRVILKRSRYQTTTGVSITD